MLLATFSIIRLSGLFWAAMLFLLSLFPLKAVNYEVYPGSAFYLTQMVDSVSYPYVAQFANGFYYHPVGFSSSSDTVLTTQQKQQICDNFSNSMAMVEGDMGGTNPSADVGDINTISGFGMTPIAAFVNRAASNLAVWRQLVANNGALNTPSYEMLAPHRVYLYPDGFYDPAYDYARSNMLVAGCAGSGVDAPVYLYRNYGSFYRQVIWDQRDWTVAHGKKFNYLISPNNSYDQQLMLDTKYLVQTLEDGGHEADVYGCVLYGLRPVDLTPETTNYNGVVQANWTITGLAYYLLKHRDGEPGSVDLYVSSNGVSYAQSVMSPVITNATQIIPFTATKTNQFTLTLTNRSAWLDYAGVLRARAATNLLANWNVTFQIGSSNITGAVLSQTGYVFLASQRWQPNSAQQVTVTIGPKGAPTPLDLVIEALPHADIEHALDVIAFQYQTNQTPPTLALSTIDRFTRQGLSTAPIWFTVGDAETISTQLVVSAVSSNTTLVPNTNIVFGKSGIQRWVNVSPAANQWGNAAITVSVTDGQFTTSKTFNLSVERTNILVVTKANNTVNLETNSSWVGNVTPGFYDQATWSNTVTSANTTTLASDMDWAGIKIANPGGPVTINGTNTLDVDVAGIDMSAATQNLTINCPVEESAFGNWNVASGRTLTINNSVGGYGGITVNGAGTLLLNSSNSFLGPLTVSAGTLLLAYPNAQSGTTLSGNAVIRAADSGAFGVGGLSLTASSSSTGRLELSNNISVLAGKSLSLNARSSSTDAIRNVSGTNTLGANISFSTGGGNYWMQSDSGKLTLAGTINSVATGTRNLTLQGAAAGEVSGSVQDGSGVLQINKAGTGTWILSGNNTYSGTTTVSAGTLLVAGNINSLAEVAAKPGTTLGGRGTINGPVTIQTNALLAPGLNGIGALAINNLLTLSNGCTVIMELDAGTGTNDSIRGLTSVSYGGSLIVTNINGTPLAGQSFKLFGSAVYDGAFTQVSLPALAQGLFWTNQLNVDGSVSVITTNGNVVPGIKLDNQVSLDQPSSWLYGLPPSAADVAVWTNLVTGPNVVNLGADANWLGLTVANPGGPVTINGTNTLTLGANGIDLSTSLVDVTLACALSNGVSATWNIATNRTLNLTGGVSAGGSSVTITKTGSGTVNFSGACPLGALSVTAGTSALGSGALSVANSGTGGFSITGTGTFLQTGGAITTAGYTRVGYPTYSSDPGKLVITGGSFVSGSEFLIGYGGNGILTIGGTAAVTGNNNLRFGQSGNATVNLFGGTLKVNTWNTGGGSSASLLLLSGGTLIYGGGGGGVWGPVAGLTAYVSTNVSTLDDNGQSFTIAQPLLHHPALGAAPDGGLIKTGAGNLTLSGTNTFTGPLVVSNGTLTVNAALNGAGNVTIAAGATLGGNGTIAGAVNVMNGGTLAPGPDLNILAISNTLTLAAGSTVYLALNQSTHTNAAVRGLTAVNYGGTLALTNLAGTLTTADSFKLFSAASFGGRFDAVSPQYPAAGLRWNTNTLAVDGTIRITNAPQVKLFGAGFIGNAFIIGSTNGSPGFPVYLLAATNLIQPPPWPRVKTNYFDATGAVFWTNAIPANTPAGFFRLETP